MFSNLKFLKKGSKRLSGRNNQGIITIRHRGGGIKKKVFFIDFFRNYKNQGFTVYGYYHRSNKFASLAILQNNKKQYHAILNAKNLLVGDKVNNYFTSYFDNFEIGSSYFLGIFPIGSHIHNLEIQPTFGGKLIKAAGCFGIVLQKSINVLVKLPSGQVAFFPLNCRATFGEISSFKKINTLTKAGQSRWLGRRPSVRGTAMNAVDHPHGGGEGKSYLGRIPVSPWGSIIKGKKK
jgi:large subunit ribosomal protein L2